MRLTRRGFFVAVGGAAGAAAVARKKLAGAEVATADIERWATPEETVVPSICQQCPGGCGLLVRVLDGEVVGIAGNPQHPVNRGALCPKAYAGVELLYDENRIKGPLARDGARGRFRPIGWDEALGLVGQRLAQLRERRLAHTVAILGGQYRGYRDVLWRRFADALGTPNYVRVRCLTPERPALAHELMQGVTAPLSYDLGGARCILSFGVNLLESWLGPVPGALAFANVRGALDHPRGRLIYVDPRRSHTAVKADRWVPIVPGTDRFLALGIANALVREGLYDKDFIEEYAQGFDAAAGGRTGEGFRDLVLRDYGLLTVSATTGVPVKMILEVARDIATTRPAIVLGERGTAYGREDRQTRMAIHALNALVGAIGAPGGLLLQNPVPLEPFPAVIRDDAAGATLAHPRLDGARTGQYAAVPDVSQALPDRIVGGSPYPINALFVFATNPLVNHPAKERFAEVLDRIPFIVSFSPFMDETSARADLILPDHTYLERWQDDQVAHIGGFTCFSIGRPAALPRQQTRNSADVLLQIAKGLGGSVRDSLRWESFEAVIRDGARGLFAAGRGYVVSAHAEESLRRILERQGYWLPEFTSYDDFWAALTKRGAWWDPTTLPVSRRAVIKTASGKFDFSPLLAERPAAAVVGDDARARAYPLRLNTYRLVTRPLGGGRNQPWLLEQPAVHVRSPWTAWVELHPETALAAGVKDGDPTWVESPKGRIKLVARVHEGTRPDVVHIPLFGGGGGNPNDLIANEVDASKGFGVFNTTRVKVYKA